MITNLVMNGLTLCTVTDRPRELVIRSGKDETQQSDNMKDCGRRHLSKSAGPGFSMLSFTTKPNGMGMDFQSAGSIIGAHGGRMSAVNNAAPVRPFSSRSRRTGR